MVPFKLQRSVLDEFTAIIQPEEPQQPCHAALYLEFCNIQLVRDISITKALPSKPVNREQDSGLFPVNAHIDSLPMVDYGL
jgi:hypothetical protein